MRFKFLKHVALPYYSGNIIWSICPYTGSLIRGKAIIKTKVSIPVKVSQALQYCNEPYSCKPIKETNHLQVNRNVMSSLNKMHTRLLNIGNKRFYLSRLYSGLKCGLFTSTIEALANINQLPSQKKYKHRLCLQRAFLASKISESFYDKGVLFIGAGLPTGEMHAWIIENGAQPDYEDCSWINYRPLLAFYH